ncbi:MAG: 30S ribosomal protein S3 [Clostridia bacterium]|jgi:small subunit ribosomal protein S3|nr:30S ribosomal protein S3 [Clostridia bacterium]
MGQKVNPHGLRVGVISAWDTQWYADKKNFSAFIKEDNDIRTFLKKKYYDAAISKITIIRAANKVEVGIYTGRPGVLIGKAGSEIEVIKKDLAKLTKGKGIVINVKKVDKIDQDAQLVAEAVAAQLEKRVSYRRAVKQQISKVAKTGIKGVKITVGGRLDGREIAGSESYHEGSIPLQTIRADIDYGFAEAHTTFGVLGIKCWIYKGEVLDAAKRLIISEGGED